MNKKQSIWHLLILWQMVCSAAQEVWQTITNAAVAAFTAVAALVRELVVDIDPVQDLHGYDSPWPAGGGKNKLKPLFANRTHNGGTFTVQPDGSVAISGSFSSTGYTPNVDISAMFSNGAYSLPAGSYIVNKTGMDGCSLSIYVFGSDGTQKSTVTANGSNNATLTISEGDKIFPRLLATTYGSYTVYPMIRLSTESDATFAPYSNICPITGWTGVNVWVEPTHDTTANPTVTIDLEGTRYGGTLDVTTGVLTVTMAYAEITYFSGKSSAKANNAYYRNISGIKRISSSTTPNILSDMYVATTYATVTSTGNTTGIGVNEYGNIVIGYGLNSTITTLELANAWVSEHPFHICYELATPVTVQLTPAEVTTLLGQNNVWADTGNINTITYRES